MNFFQSAAPLYSQVKQFIIDQIKEGKYPVNEAIPTEMELQQMLSVSRTTVRQAVNELVAEGCLFRKRGIGTFVSDVFNKPKIPLTHITISSSRLISSTGRSLRREIVKTDHAAANAEIAAYLQVPVQTPIWIFHRVEYGDDMPLTLTRSYTPAATMPNFKHDIRRIEEGFHVYLEGLGYPVRRASYTISATLLTDPYDIKLLKMQEKSPALTISAVNMMRDGTPVEYSLTILNSDILSLPIISVLE